MELTTSEYCHKLLFNYIRLKGYSLKNTFPVYKANLNIILNRFPEPKEANILELQDFAAEFKNPNTRRNICIMIRWLFGTVYNTPIDWRLLPYPKRSHKIQSAYSQENILKIINAINNEKHKAIIALIADCGLRISEPCSILLTDCFQDERKIILRSAKGDYDRVVYPSEFAWGLIKEYQQDWMPKSVRFLFEGQMPGNPYTPESIRAVLKLYCRITGVEYLGVHAIRRFSGTWWAENGVPFSVAANNLGHKSTRTFEKSYVIHSAKYLRNIPSPIQLQLPA